MNKLQFGGKTTPESIKQYEQSENWKEGKFENQAETSMKFSLLSMPRLIYKQFVEKKGREPKKPLKVAKFEQKEFLDDSTASNYIWYGHSSVLLRINGKTILIDPMMGPNAAPISPFAVNRFSENTLDIIDQWPQIDLVLLTHDHYDHLDLASIEKLKPKVQQFFVAIGCKRHLQAWGIEEGIIKEFDWWDKKKFNDIDITFTPTRHFSGRGLKDRAKCLWGGWALRSEEENFYFSGDSGFGQHFKEIGKKLGPFDFAMIECGQYNENWHQIHMFPEESIQAAKDTKSKKIMPVHWAGFALAQHTWTDPVERFVAKAELDNMPYCLPRLGKVYSFADMPIIKWWI